MVLYSNAIHTTNLNKGDYPYITSKLTGSYHRLKWPKGHVCFLPKNSKTLTCEYYKPDLRERKVI